MPQPRILSLFQKWSRKVSFRDTTFFLEEEQHIPTQSFTSFFWRMGLCQLFPTLIQKRPPLAPQLELLYSVQKKLTGPVHKGWVKGMCSAPGHSQGAHFLRRSVVREGTQFQGAANLKSCLNSAWSWATLGAMPLIPLNLSSFFQKRLSTHEYALPSRVIVRIKLD